MVYADYGFYHRMVGLPHRLVVTVVGNYPGEREEEYEIHHPGDCGYQPGDPNRSYCWIDCQLEEGMDCAFGGAISRPGTYLVDAWSSMTWHDYYSGFEYDGGIDVLACLNPPNPARMLAAYAGEFGRYVAPPMTWRIGPHEVTYDLLRRQSICIRCLANIPDVVLAAPPFGGGTFEQELFNKLTSAACHGNNYQPAHLRDSEWQHFFVAGPRHRVRYIWIDTKTGVLHGTLEDGSEL